MPEKVWNENTCVARAGRDVLGQQRIVGRVIDRIGEPQHREHGDEYPERVDQRRDRNRAGAQQQAADEIEARAGAIDQEADRRLQHAPRPR